MSSKHPPPWPVIDLDAASDSDIEIPDPAKAVDSDASLSDSIPIIPQTRRASQRDTDSQSDRGDDTQSEFATQPPLSAAVSENGTQGEAGEDSGGDVGGSDLHIHASDMNEEDATEEWEHELDEMVQHSPAEIKDWKVLRAQIKQDLKKKSKILTLSAINRLMIVANFATLRLKGVSRITASEEIARQWHEGEGKYFARRVRALARHYQTFEQLPVECRGGYKNARSLLKDENVKKRALSYLQSLPTGKVTPKKLQEALNTVVLPDLGITTKKPLCIRTARRWLIKLGWRNTVVKKGVYMDGHERVDVVDYRQKFFLPAMAEFEKRMAQYEGPELKRIPPTLAPGEREIIPNFHDESTFHGNEESRSAWLRNDEQPLRKKGRGKLIHVSAFINPETGRLIYVNKSGHVRDSTKIIYPGSQGDAWWDTEQLLVQMADAVEVFELAHQGKQALFIFDQSSAHASLPPDALKAFEMNKSDGGKQCKQRDTIIPESNPVAEHRGKTQKMTLENGQAKGMQRVLQERGFDVARLRAKCSPVCPIENTNCCMARLLSRQDDFKNQPSMLETFIHSRGHECIFLPKFHCELNPIEMVFIIYFKCNTMLINHISIGDGVNTGIVK